MKGKKYFFKIASHKKLNTNLQNEISWNTQINTLTKEEQKPFHMPTVIQQGLWKGRRYAIFECFPSKHCCSFSNRKLKKDFSNSIPLIIDFLFWLRTIQIQLPLDTSTIVHDIGSTTKSILAHAIQQSKDTGKNCKKLLDIIHRNKIRRTSLAHCEIKPGHIYNHHGTLKIIDGEWASQKIPEHYDIVSLYARVYTKSQNPRMAKNLLQQYLKKCVEHHIYIREFKKQFKAILAWRAIGEYREALRRQKVYPEHERLLKISSRNIFTKKY